MTEALEVVAGNGSFLPATVCPKLGRPRLSSWPRLVTGMHDSESKAGL